MHQPSKPAQFAIHQTESQKILNPAWFIRRPMVSWHTFPPFFKESLKCQKKTKSKSTTCPKTKKNSLKKSSCP
ncbi:hypothetical protein NEIMUCOT_04565 [Neisseria mucosa ATCC 25996]|uniref:Uncharacterized protein n=1 Tax=Neisseria mucosa (strain ATCC 25996 / DSM 4631 / NCTC 10774 / M26) TaxID=546266 RepID=D2ZVC2_NEIM2|nr:hypothetical protein NEIMUCOT_04565 [Neisseria mucosa ATCC 25996]